MSTLRRLFSNETLTAGFSEPENGETVDVVPVSGMGQVSARVTKKSRTRMRMSEVTTARVTARPISRGPNACPAQ